MARKIVLTGTSGKLGGIVARALIERGLGNDVRFGSRNAEALAGLAADGYETATVDFDDPAGMEAAFAGAETVLLISGNAPDDLRIAQHRAAIDAAKKAGVVRIVYTSFTNPSTASRFTAARVHAETEAALAASGLASVIFRNNSYASNLDGLLAHARQTGQLGSPGAAGKVAYVTHEDIAASMAAVLGDGGPHDGKVYEMTGGEALDLHEVAALAAGEWGMTVTAGEVPPEPFGQVLASAGLPPFVVELLLSFYAAIGAGELAGVSGDVERLTGRAPRTIRETVRKFA